MKPTPEQIEDWINAGVEARWKALESGLSVDDAPTIAEGSYARCAAWAREQALEEAAKACDALEVQWHHEYKGIVPSEHRGSQHHEGKSDGATDCAEAIRALKGEQS